MGITGVIHLADVPDLLVAFDPRHAVGFVIEHRLLAFVVLSAIFLASPGPRRSAPILAISDTSQSCSPISHWSFRHWY
jgi:hypothetical protein